MINFGMVIFSNDNLKPFAACNGNRNVSLHAQIGPIIDGGAPYSAIFVTELCVIRSSLGLPSLTKYDPLLDSISHYKYWHYGGGSHSSEKRLILGSVSLTCYSGYCKPISI